MESIIRNVLDKLRNILDGTNVGVSGPGAFHSTKAYPTHTLPHIKHETDAIYGPSSVHSLNNSLPSYAATTGRATFSSYGEAQNTYQAAHLPYTGQSYGASTQQNKQVHAAQTGASASYPATNSLNYYQQSQDATSSSRTATPATDWMRWSQAHLNPFAPQTQSEYATPLAPNTLMAMSDVRSTSSTSRGQGTESQPQQWPFNYYSGTQYTTSNAG